MTRLEDFENEVWRELSWRKKELLQLRLQAKSAPEWAWPMQLRSATTLLYAHWEGFVKAAGEALVRFVRDQGLKQKDLAAGYLAIALRSELSGVRESERNVLMPEIQLARAITDRDTQVAVLRPKGSVPTGSNLSWRQFEMVAARLEVESREFVLLEHFIDQGLVQARNTVAHGNQSSPQARPEYLVIHAKLLGLLDRFAHEVLRVAEEGKYRRDWTAPSGRRPR